MVQEQADLALGPGPVIHDPQKVMQFHQRHVGMHKLDIRTKQRVLQAQRRQRKDLLLDQVLPVLGQDPVRDGLDEGRPFARCGGGGGLLLERRPEERVVVE
jgi:hypothetical protein